MRLITHLPLSKTHAIPLFTCSCLCITITALFCLLIPFFLVFTQGFFRNSIQSYEQFHISSTQEYYLTATSTQMSIVSSNLMPEASFQSNLFVKNIQISEQDYDGDGKNDYFSFEAEIQQGASLGGSLTDVSVVLFFDCWSSSLNTTAMIMYNLKGSSIKSAMSTGSLKLQQNALINSSSNTVYSSNQFTDNYYDLGAAFESYYQQATFFSKESTEMVTNDNTNIASVKVILDLRHQQRQLVKAGVFEQLQWSWCYYFPIALALGLVSVRLLDLMLKYGMIESVVLRNP